MLLGLFAAVVAVSLGLITWRADLLRPEHRIRSPLSREGAFLANNLVFTAFAAVVLIGTVFPLVLEAVNGSRISVGVPYFSRMTMPIGFALLTLMAIAPALPWRRAPGDLVRERLFWPAVTGVSCLAIAVLLGATGWAALLAFGLGGFAAGSAIRQLAMSVRRNKAMGLVGRTNGGMIVHLGTILIAVAFAASTTYATQSEMTLEPGESAEVGGHTVEYLGPVQTQNDRMVSTGARIEVDGADIHEPRLNRYRSSGMVIGTPSVRWGPFEDVYLSLTSSPTGSETSGEVGLRVIVQPLVSWIWLGGIVMGIGTALALVPARGVRVASEPKEKVLS
jgi:cytochrome c-type biogenesis protein CcmF